MDRARLEGASKQCLSQNTNTKRIKKTKLRTNTSETLESNNNLAVPLPIFQELLCTVSETLYDALHGNVLYFDQQNMHSKLPSF